MTELKPTYGNFTLRGEVVWKRDNSYDENTSANGNTYRRINFGVKTAEDNIVEVGLFQTKFDDVTLRNDETKKRDKKVPYGKHTENLPEGYSLFMPVNVGLKQDDEGKNIKEKLITFDAIKYINDNLENGQSVFIFGSVSRSKSNKDGEVYFNTRFEPRGIYLTSDNLGDESFTSQSTFDQQFILTDSELQKSEGKLIVNGNVVTNKDGDFVPAKFYIDINKYKKMAMNVNKLKYGTVLDVKGFIHHTVTQKEIEVEDDGWGEDPEPKTAEEVTKELEITKVEKPTRESIGKYKPEDFTKKEDDESNPFKDDSEVDEWGEDPGSSSDDDSDDDDPFKDLD